MTMVFQAAPAQKIQNVYGEYRYVVPDNVTMAEARRTAEKRARTEAIAEAFGTVITQSNSTVIKNDTGKSTVDFLSLNESDVKGEWLSNTRDTEFQFLVDEYTGQQVVICRVWGKAREIVAAKVDFTAKILRKEADPAFESETFKNGDQFYLYFSSPTDGYLAVYMVDAEQTAYCLLPYMNDTDGTGFYWKKNIGYGNAPIPVEGETYRARFFMFPTLADYMGENVPSIIFTYLLGTDENNLYNKEISLKDLKIEANHVTTINITVE